MRNTVEVIGITYKRVGSDDTLGSSFRQTPSNALRVPQSNMWTPTRLLGMPVIMRVIRRVYSCNPFAMPLTVSICCHWLYNK